MNIGFISLGCAKNQVDSEEIISYLKRNGANMTPNPELADVICINTCAFIEAAKKEAIDTILEMSKYKKPIVVMGCLAQRYGKDLAEELPEVKLWIPFGSYDTFGEQFKKHFLNLWLKEKLIPTIVFFFPLSMKLILELQKVAMISALLRYSLYSW